MPIPPLAEHPEGGRYAEIFRSPRRVTTPQGERDALTHIYFELAPGEVSRFHRVASDEVWNLYRGALRLFLWDGEGEAVETVELSAAVETFCHVVPAGTWQAAEPVDGPCLVGCSVGPGFAFEDFELVDGSAEAVIRLREARPELERLL